MLEVKNLSLTKGKTVILSDLSLSFQKKSITLLLGESGSGKSSLLRCLAGLETEYRGEITFDGNSLRGMSSFARVKIMSFISQSYALFPHMTVLENCQGALKIVFKDDADVAKRKSMEALDRLGMSAYANAYPHQLSGGQKQRVAIARALVLNPEILLFDEPTSALDPENAKMLSQILQELSRQGTGIVIATHDLLFAKELENDLGSSYRKEIISKA